MSKSYPPRLWQRFLAWYCKPALKESIMGDLEEQFYEEVEYSGQAKAGVKYAWNVIRFFRPEIIKDLEGTIKLNQYGMFKNYLKVSMRNILRNKTFSLLNVAGLSVGIASCLLILIYVKNELSYDTYHSKYDRIYRVLHYYGANGEIIEEHNFPVSEYRVWGNAPVADAMLDYFPQIEALFRFTSTFDWLIEYKDKRFQEKGIVYGDSTAHKVFDWNWIAGNPAEALTRPNTIALSKKLSNKYFGDENPIGKTLKMDGEDLFEVTAVYEIPANSHFQLDGIISMLTFINRRSQVFEWWDYVDFYSYFTLKEHATIGALTAEIPSFIETYHEGNYAYTIRFEPLADAYLNSEARRQPGPVGNRNNLYIFISVALFILVIAAINFMNLATARSMERAKEVAIRKSIGSQRASIIQQFLIEAVLLTSFSCTLGIILVVVGRSYLEILIDKPLPAGWLLTPNAIVTGIISVLLLGILSGSYPAFVLSKFKPVKVLKGAFKNSSEGVWLRKSLVVLQFSLSIILLAGATVVYKQLVYLKNYDKGFDPNQVLIIDYGWDDKVQLGIDAIKEELSKHSAVEQVASSRATPGDFFPNAGTSVEAANGEMEGKSPAIFEIDEDFIPTFDIEVVAGRNYYQENPLRDTSALIMNESAARLYGYANPEDIIGKKFMQWGREGKVVGVVKDFNYVSLHQKVEPLTLRYATRWNTSMLSLKLKSADYGATLRELEDLWETLAPHRPFLTHFSDDNFNRQYETDERFGTVFTIFSGLAIFVACLGLFGLTIYSTAQRTKEIGVRKVLGATNQQIVAILSLDFMKLFGISLLLAIPISWYIMAQWLSDFAYRTTLGFEVFVIASLIIFVISILTMSFKTIQAASSNPVVALKDE